MTVKRTFNCFPDGKKSFASQPFDLRRLFGLIQQLETRLANVVIENQDFETLIHHYDRPDTFFYLDPPYFSTEDMYTVEFAWADHGRSVIVRREKLCDDCQGKATQDMAEDKAMLLELLDSLPTELQKAAFVQLSESLGRLPRREIRTGPPRREIQGKRGAVLADPDIPN